MMRGSRALGRGTVTMPNESRLQGRRCDDTPTVDLARGDYKLEPNGEVWFHDPKGNLAHIAPHIWAITVHGDQTISVSPSIRVNAGRATEWHGYLERGVWRTVPN